MKLLATVALLATGVQEDPAALVDTLIAKTNALKSFVAEYHVQASSRTSQDEECEGELRLVYRAPEELFLELRLEDLRVRTVLARGKMSMHIEEPGRTSHGESAVPDSIVEARSRIARVFHEQFPALGSVADSGDEVFVRFRVTPASVLGRYDAQFELGRERGEGSLLGWLGELRRPNARVAVEEDFLHFRPKDEVSVFLSRSTGFVERVEVTYPTEKKTRLKLKNLVLDGEVEDSEFRLPEANPSSLDISKLVVRLVGLSGLMTVRNMIGGRVREAVDTGKLEWNDEVRSRFELSLRSHHRELGKFVLQQSLADARSRVDEISLWYQDSKRAVPEGDTDLDPWIEKERASWESKFREEWESRSAHWIKQIADEVSEGDSSPIAVDMRTLNHAAAETAFREDIVNPLLEYLSEQMERAKRGELQPPKR